MAKNDLITPEERRNLATSIQERVDELTFPELANQTNDFKKAELNKIELEIRNYLIKYTRMAQLVNNITEKYDFNNNKSKALNLYILYKSLINTDMTNLLQDGYILIETLRKTFTGKEIEYEVGMEYSVSRGNYQLINKKISLAELLSYSRVSIDWGASGIGAFKLRAYSNKGDFLAEYEKQRLEMETAISDLHSLYPKVKSTLFTVKNKGNIYEVYQQLKHTGWADHSPKRQDPIKLDADTIIEKYIEVKSGIQSFVTGGDFEMVQFKLLSAAPSIATLGTIGNALKLILTYLEKGKNVNTTIDDIKMNVFSKEFDKKINNGIFDLLQDVNEELSSYLKMDKT